jgi:hypothetical protein
MEGDVDMPLAVPLCLGDSLVLCALSWCSFVWSPRLLLVYGVVLEVCVVSQGHTTGPGCPQAGFSALRYVSRGFRKKKAGLRTPRPPPVAPLSCTRTHECGGTT